MIDWRRVTLGVGAALPALLIVVVVVLLTSCVPSPRACVDYRLAGFMQPAWCVAR
jgi:hypothetical protein